MKYRSVILDCDGVILDSNDIKTDAFRTAIAGYDEAQIHVFEEFHRRNGGVSRFQKIEYFLREIVGNYSKREYERILRLFEQSVQKQLRNAPFTRGAVHFLEYCQDYAALYLVSGGYQEELREIFAHKNVDRYFQDILGSPVTKPEHFEDLLNIRGISAPVLFVGDSVCDHQVATEYGVDFVFLSGYTDLEDWQQYCAKWSIEHYPDFNTMMISRRWN